MLKNTLLFLFISLLYGCNDGSNVKLEPIKENIKINKSVSLTRNYENTTFTISGNDIVFDLNGFELKNNSNNITIFIANKSTNVVIKGGTITGNGYATGIHISACVTENDAIQLTKIGSTYEPIIYDKCSNNIRIREMKFSKLRTGVYVANYTYNNLIINSVFNNIDRMAIYLDAGSKNTTIKNNIFFNNGFRSIEDSGRRRGHISIDSSIYNTIENNKFTDTKIKKAYVNYNTKDYLVPVIELYRNCGEKTPNWNTILPRLNGADYNTINNNEFNTQGLGIWFKYRDHDQLSSCVANYPDKSDNNTALGNSFSGISIYDDGINNKW